MRMANIPFRSVVITSIIMTAIACRAPAPTTALYPLMVPIRAEMHRLANGGDSVQLSVRAILRNPFPDTLTLENICGGGALHLQYAVGESWRPVLQGLRTYACVGYSEVRVPPGDSTVLTHVISGTHADRHLGVRWLAPLSARYRLATTASRCVRHGRLDCWVTLTSAPFDIMSPAPPGDRP